MSMLDKLAMPFRPLVVKRGVLQRQAILVYPLALATFPVVYWHAQNAREAFLSDVLGTLALILASTILITLLLRLVIRDNTKVAAAVSVLLVVFFSYGAARHVLLFRIDLFIGHEPYLSRILVTIAVIAVLAVILYRGNLIRPVQLVTVMALALVLFNAGWVIATSQGTPGNVLIDGQPPNEIQLAPPDAALLPDIYFILVDAYSRADHIQENYYYDNGEFIESLTRKGFFVVPESSSNYSHTWMSTAAALSMRYLHSEDDEISLVHEIPVGQVLSNIGYQYVHIQSGRGVTKRNSRADVELYDKNPKNLLVNEFSLALLNWTLAAPVAGDVGVKLDLPFMEKKAKSFRNSMRWLRDVPAISGPTFTFSHVYPIHTPYIFLRDGSLRPNVTESPGVEDGRKLYVEALIYTNETLNGVVEDILERSTTEPVIIIQGDHSAWGMPWSMHTERDQLAQRTAIFNALYLPEYCRSGLYPTMSPVNTFRVVLNNCLGADLPLLPDESYDAYVSIDCARNEICGPESPRKQ